MGQQEPPSSGHLFFIGKDSHGNWVAQDQQHRCGGLFVGRAEAAALAGLAPFDDDSGKHKGERHIAGGRRRLRRSLFAAALPAAFHWNKALIELYARLIARGKAHNEALIACARKLLIYANTVVQRGTPWTETPAAA